MSIAAPAKPKSRPASTSESLVEFFAGIGVSGETKVDRENHVVRGVKLLGLESKNGRSYSPAAIKAALGLYEGAKINVNHPKDKPDSPRAYEDRLGSAHHVRFVEGQGLFGDVFYNPHNRVAEQFAHDAEKAPGNGGFSHNIEGRTVTRNGRKVVEAITKVTSVDLVADPATTSGMYEHLETQGADDMALETCTLEQLAAANPALVKQISEAAVTEHKGSEESKAKDTEIKKLKEDLDKLTSAAKLSERKGAVDKKIAEAKLPEALVTELFRESCYEADDAKLAKLIEERQAIAKGLPSQPASKRPTSGDQQVTEGANSFPVVSDSAQYASSLRRAS